MKKIRKLMNEYKKDLCGILKEILSMKSVVIKCCIRTGKMVEESTNLKRKENQFLFSFYQPSIIYFFLN